MNHVFHRHTKINYPTAAKGDGCYIIDSNGKRYLDGSSGAAVSCLGHSHPAIREAMKSQIDNLAFAHTGFFTNEPMENLADFLVKRAPEGLERVYFFSGGSEAVEGAIKLARQYFVEIGRPEKHKVIARWQSYHGNTLGALAAGGNKWRRAQFEPLLIDVQHVPPCYEYRDRREGESVEAYGQRVANRLEEVIQHTGQESVAAFIAEPVVGATMGCVPSVTGYFERIKAICDKYDVLLILDEVMCGMGRTGSLFACEQDGITADLITVAKGLGAGYQPIGALLASGRVYDAVAQGSGFFQHGHTYIGHATACAAALRVQQVIEEDNLLEHVRNKGEQLQTKLEAAFSDHPHVGDVRGRGLFRGVEIVKDRKTQEPFESELAIHAKIKAQAMDQGLMCYPMGGTIDGRRGAHILLAPPFIIEDAEIDELVEKLGRTFSTVFR